jgi:hypothetical protein
MDKNGLAGIVTGGIFIAIVVVAVILSNAETVNDEPRELDYSSEGTTDQSIDIDDYLAVFPLSTRAKNAFRTRIKEEQLSPEQVGELIWQLMAEGETLMSESDMEEIISLYAKAIATLTPEEQMFIQKVNLLVGQGGGYSADDQQKSGALIQKGFSQLADQDNNRFLRLRAKAIELALLRPQEAQQTFKSIYPPPSSGIESMAIEQKEKRIQELISKAIASLPESDRSRFLHLHSTPADQLSAAEYEERINFTNRIMPFLSEAEIREIMQLTMSISEDIQKVNSDISTQQHTIYKNIYSVPRIVQEHPGLADELEDEIYKLLYTTEDDDFIKLMELTNKALSYLNEDELEQLIPLHDKLIKHGHTSLTEEELLFMQSINKVAIDRLPIADREELEIIVNRISNSVDLSQIGIPSN